VRGEWLSPPRPKGGIILYIHGGGYVSGSPRTHRPITAALARMTGRRVFSAEYRLAPESSFPAAFDDVCESYAWLLTQAGNTPIAVAGDSAGGGLALAVAMHIRDAGWPPPACVVALSPWTDLTGTSRSVAANDGRCAMFRPQNLPAFAAAYLAGMPADDPRASPLYGRWDHLPPVLMQVGSTELLYDDARRVHERILAAGGSSQLSQYKDVVHGWQLLAPFVPEAGVAQYEGARFIEQHLCSSRPDN
jgi:acetyl esterase/lipase